MTKPSKKEPGLSMFAGGASLARLARTSPPPKAGAKGVGGAKCVARPAVKRAREPEPEHLPPRVRARIVDEIDAALKRKPASEAKLAGVVRALGPLSPELRGELFRAGEVLVRRATVNRDLWSAIVRTLADADHPGLEALLGPALGLEEGGGSSTLSSAAFSSAGELVAPLGKLASGAKPFIAFAAEVARVVRGDSPGAHLLHLAPIIKEAHRVALATSVVAPLVRGLDARVVRAVEKGAVEKGGAKGRAADDASRGPRGPLAGERLGPGFEVLRSAERHLGRWLLFAEAVVLGGDERPLTEAREKSVSGADSSRSAWSLVAWALGQAHSRRTGATPPPPPETRPTTEISARLSDRPSADRDLSFLFRLAAARAPSAKPMLESLVRGPLDDEAHVRAALHLARDYGRGDLLAALRLVATGSIREEMRGLAFAALHDAGDTLFSKELADEALVGRHLGNAAWAARVLSPSVRGFAVTEAAVRHIQWGAVE